MRWVRVHNLEDNRPLYLNLSKFYVVERCPGDTGGGIAYTYLGLTQKVYYMVKESPEDILSGA